MDVANYDDVERDKDPARRAVTLSKLAKFQQLRDVPMPRATQSSLRASAQSTALSDRSDIKLLVAIGDGKLTAKKF